MVTPGRRMSPVYTIACCVSMVITAKEKVLRFFMFPLPALPALLRRRRCPWRRRLPRWPRLGSFLLPASPPAKLILYEKYAAGVTPIC